MTPASGLLVALVLLAAGVVGVIQSVRNGLWEQPRWRIFLVAWIAVAGAVVLYGSYVVSNT